MGSFIPFISHLQEISRHYLETKTILHVPPNYKAHNNLSHVTASKNLLLKRKHCQNLLREQKILKKSSSSPYKCCGRDFKCFSHLEQHRNTLAHRGLVSCQLCSEVVKKEDFLKHRAEIHNQIKGKWKCEACHEVFARNVNLIHHMKSQQPNSNLYKCSVCAQTFTMKCSYTLHYKSHCVQSEGKWKCEGCHEVFATKKKLLRHFHTVHCKSHHASSALCDVTASEHSSLERKPCQNEMAAKEIVQGPYECCGTYFQNRNLLEEHKKSLVHQGLVFCRICRKVVKKEDFLKHRAEIHNQIEGKWECKACHKFFSERKNFTRHLNLYKGNLYTCIICQKTFTMKCSYTVHCKSHARFVCKCCGIDFKDVSKLEQHRREMEV